MAKGVGFKARGVKFEASFIVCKLSRIDFVLGNTFLDFYGVEVRRRPKLGVVVVGDDGKPKFLPHT